MNTLRFRDGLPVPGDEVMHDPDVAKRYGDASQARLAAPRAKLLKYLAYKGRRPAKHPGEG